MTTDTNIKVFRCVNILDLYTHTHTRTAKRWLLHKFYKYSTNIITA